MSQAHERWVDLSREFYYDGSWRDIYVLDTCSADWSNAMRFISEQEYGLSFRGAWTRDALPDDVQVLFVTADDPERARTTLTLDISGLHMNCHFFCEDEIEFDIDPREVDSPTRLAALLDFMRGLASAVGKDVLMTPENMPELEIFRAKPGEPEVRHTPFGGFR